MVIGKVCSILMRRRWFKNKGHEFNLPGIFLGYIHKHCVFSVACLCLATTSSNADTKFIMLTPYLQKCDSVFSAIFLCTFQAYFSSVFSWLLFLELDFTGSSPYGSQFSPTWNPSSLIDLSQVPIFSQVPLLVLNYRWSHNHTIHPPVEGLLSSTGTEPTPF